MKSNCCTRILSVLFILLISSRINAQAVIEGLVTDAAAKPISHATVRLLNTPSAVISNDAGQFVFNKLLPGRYIIEITAIGYASQAKEIIVTAASSAPLRFQLQTSLRQLETVVVSAGKKEELLQKIPVSVTALTAQQVSDYRLWNIGDLSGIVPNLYAGNPGDERNVTSIRGITTTSYDPSVTTYIDGVNQFSLDTYIPQLADIERIEILRGPQGTLYGRNAMGGVINIVTKKPSAETGGFVELSAGNYHQQRYSGGLRFPLVKNKLSAGFAFAIAKRNGYYQNEFNNSSFDKQQQNGVQYYLQYLPGSNWTIGLHGKLQLNRNNGAFPVVNGVDDALQHPFVLNQNAIGKMVDNTYNTALSLQHKGAVADISIQTAWQNNYRYYQSPIDGDFSPLDAVTVINDYGRHWNNVKVFTNEFRITSADTKTSKLGWTAGTYFFHQYVPNKQATHFGKDAGALGIPATDFSSINTSTGRNTGLALYGQLTYQLLPKLSLVAGLRYDYERRKLNVMGEYQPDGSAPMVTTPDTSATVHFNALSPKLALRYELGAGSSLYAGYSRGYRTGGLTQLSGDPSAPPLYPYSPEYSNNIELGSKNDFFNNRLRVNAVLFLTYLNNAQVPVLVLPDAITVTKNTGRLNSRGAELEIAANPLKGLEFTYSAGYTHAVYKSTGISAGGQIIDLNGKRQIFTPDITSLAALQYSIMLSEKQQWQLTARGEWFYFGKRYFDFANSIEQGAYQLLNAKLGIHNRHWGIWGWWRNAGNTKYIAYAYDFGAVHLGNPRTIGVTLSARF
ncbi:MAG TPA: TonB-dependent receptor [Chitinophagaceae bacterium]|nr:TonB-dependent receptor [Chitinophagaceae bacterium]